MEQINLKESLDKRLNDIDNELNELKEKEQELSKRWEEEKRIIHLIRGYKAEIEDTKSRAEKMERDGDLAKVAELRYGVLHELEAKLNNANNKLNEIQKSGKLLKEEVDAEDIAEVVAKWTGVPVSKMLESERIKLLKMEERIHNRLISQEEAVSAVANAIRRSRSGLQDANKPIGSFIFLGSTGVGKTEMARALAEFLFDDENALIRIDMSEYMEKFSVTRLIGAPPGYVGYEEGGQLTEAVRIKPYSVILLDEIEKANKDVFNVLLQVLDDGRLTDGKGRVVNFKNTIIIMTSNLGAEILNNSIDNLNDTNRDNLMLDAKIKIIDLLKKNMRPEFLNRIDEIVLFKPLNSNEIGKIALLQIQKLIEKLKNQGIAFEVHDSAIEWLSKIGYDAHYGARPLKRAIQKYVSDVLAVKLLSGEISHGDTIELYADDNGSFKFRKTIADQKALV